MPSGRRRRLSRWKYAAAAECRRGPHPGHPRQARVRRQGPRGLRKVMQEYRAAIAAADTPEERQRLVDGDVQGIRDAFGLQVPQAIKAAGARCRPGVRVRFQRARPGLLTARQKRRVGPAISQRPPRVRHTAGGLTSLAATAKACRRRISMPSATSSRATYRRPSRTNCCLGSERMWWGSNPSGDSATAGARARKADGAGRASVATIRVKLHSIFYTRRRCCAVKFPLRSLCNPRESPQTFKCARRGTSFEMRDA
jgi:hypothetical protein